MAYVLKSGSLFKDAIMGITAVIVGIGISFILSLRHDIIVYDSFFVIHSIGILISSKLYIYTEKSVWYLDSIIGLMIGGLLYTVALSTLISEWDHKW